MIDIIKPLRPLQQSRETWFPSMLSPRESAQCSGGYPIERWLHAKPPYTVLSAVEVARERDGSSHGPEYHISISKASWPNGIYRPVRIDTVEAKWVLHQFGVDGALEDNHVAHGIARNFWRPVAEGLVGIECKCNADEVEIRENKGDYIWRP